METSYKEGAKHGPDISYYENGRIVSESYFENNLEEGTRNQYYDSGILMRTEKFSQGVSVSHAKTYDYQGNLVDVE
jgi:antitoxin component YwqK of YwqJK toxin-antitoxin module